MNKEELEKKKAAFLRELEDESPFDKEKFAANLKSVDGTMTESALMMEHGEIGVRTWSYGPGEVRGDGWSTISSDEENYEEAKRQYCLSNPGDYYCIIKKWIDGEWVVIEEHKPETEI